MDDSWRSLSPFVNRTVMKLLCIRLMQQQQRNMEGNTWNSSSAKTNSTGWYNQQQPGSYNVGPTDTIILTLALWVIFGVVCCVSRCCSRCGNAQQQLQEQQQQQEQRQREREIEVKEDKTTRIAFIKSNLPYRTIELGDETVGDEEMGDVSLANKRQSSLRSLPNTTSARSLQSQDDEVTTAVSSTAATPRRSALVKSPSRFPVCSICLSSYHKGDTLSWSTNPCCPHEYHRECIYDWLISHEECPMCRNVFLVKPSIPVATLQVDLDAPPSAPLPQDEALHENQVSVPRGTA